MKILDKFSSKELSKLVKEAEGSSQPVYVRLEDKIEVTVRRLGELDNHQKEAAKALKSLLLKIESFEEKYSMDSGIFFYKFENGHLEESEEFLSWWIAFSAFQDTLSRFNLTRSDVQCLQTEE